MQNYSEWCKKHAAMFGLFNPQDAEMMNAWRIVFERALFTFEELMAASNQMALKPPIWRTQHLGAIMEAVKNSRLKMNREVEEAAREEWDRCPNCRGSGLVPVPHYKCVSDGKWEPRASGGSLTWYEMAVGCGCAKGQDLLERLKEKRIMSLEQYERICPTWREQMKDKVADRDRQRTANTKASDLDKQLGPLFKRVVEKAKGGER